MQDADGHVQSVAAYAVREQATLPSTTIKALIQLLQHLGESAYEEAVDLITIRQELRSLVPTFDSSVLQHFVKSRFTTASVICFIDKDCFCVGASEHFQSIPLQQRQLNKFRVQWHVRDGLSLPILDTCVFRHWKSLVLSAAHTRDRK